MNNEPKLSAQLASDAQDELADRRRPGRPKHVNPHLIPLLRDPAGGEAGAADALDESARAYYLAREERFRTALGRASFRAPTENTVDENKAFTFWERGVAKIGSAYTATVFAIAGRLVPEFRERRPEEDYHDDKYIGHY
jgi:hypothetical protein